MKLLLFSDLHASVQAAHSIVRKAADADVLIGAGDFGNERRQLMTCIGILKVIDKPVVLVSGNNETTNELRDACRDWHSATVLHGSSVVIDGVTFFGIGGGIPATPFGAWSYDFSEEQAAQLLAPCPPGAILISHSPPHGAVDVTSQGLSLGSTALREAVLRTEPILVVCGHIHASAGQQDDIGSSPIVNVGPNAMEWMV